MQDILECWPASRLFKLFEWRPAMHALIIEDEIMIAAAIEYVLRDSGFDSFDVAASSNAAVAAARRRCPDLITADVKLAAGTGIEAIRTICPELAVPVIFITG